MGGAGGNLPQPLSDRVAVLTHEDELVRDRTGCDRKRTAMLDDVETRYVSVGHPYLIAANAKYGTGKHRHAGEHFTHWFHARPFATNGESARQRVAYADMARNRSSSIGAELGWLVLFLVIFVAITYCMLRFIVPLHFNDRIAVILAAIVSGVIWVVIRAWYVSRAGSAGR